MPSCSNCTLHLLRLAEHRAPAVKLVRWGLRAGMRILAACHGISPRNAPQPSSPTPPECQHCLRFVKLELKRRSPLFVWLNAHINPRFDALLEHLLRPEELAEARAIAARSFTRTTESSPQVPPR